jgi:hypothetical protein
MPGARDFVVLEKNYQELYAAVRSLSCPEELVGSGLILKANSLLLLIRLIRKFLVQ